VTGLEALQLASTLSCINLHHLHQQQCLSTTSLTMVSSTIWESLNRKTAGLCFSPAYLRRQGGIHNQQGQLLLCTKLTMCCSIG
jgi:hypothetical protein